MANKEPFEITELPETYVAGLALRTNNKTEQALKDQGWIAKTWEEVRQMEDPNLPAAIYTGYAGDKNDDFSVVIGFQRDASDNFIPGEVISKVPAGTYARFTGKGPLPDVVVEAWQEVWKAEEEGKLQRAYSADLEIYPGMLEGSNEDMSNLTVELYIAIK
jgi:predicted transcriptional regulator YdeE